MKIKKVGRAIRQYRKSHKITAQRMGSLLGFKGKHVPYMVFAIERGIKPIGLDKVIAFSKLSGIKLEELLIDK